MSQMSEHDTVLERGNNTTTSSSRAMTYLVLTRVSRWVWVLYVLGHRKQVVSRMVRHKPAQVFV
jgi:hypothetical protein